MTSTLNVGNREIPVDEEGFLEALTDWDSETAIALASAEAITLEDAHWEIIHTLRQFYTDYEHAPAMRPFTKYVKLTLGEDKGRSIYLLKLFPGSPAKIAAKIAGLPRPDNCL